jgi:hypothetical protein
VSRLRIWRKSKERRKQEVIKARYERVLQEEVGERGISPSVEENVNYIKSLLGDSSDLITRSFIIQGFSPRKAAVLYIDELVSKDINHNFILRPLLSEADKREPDLDLWEFAVKNIVQAGETKDVQEMKEVVDGILRGDTVLMIDGYAKALVMGTKGWATRSVGEPRAEAVVRGPREGLSETVSFSLAMIRRRLKDPHLRVKMLTSGERTQTGIALLYIDGICDDAVVKEIEQRIDAIKIDGILESGYIEEMIMDQTWTPFPLMQNTERPDSVVAHLLEGKAAILVDGSPHALIAPAVFSQFYYSPEDYYERFHISTFLRVIRLFSLFMALLMPSLYIAFVSFHPEMIPTKLAIAMSAGRATVPFTPIIEALIMEVSVEVLREASIRLPGPIGPTIGIVGALVIGNAAVTAGLVSPTFVIVVGLTTISSYANPSYNAAISIRLIRFPMMILAAVFGLYGIMVGLMLLLLHLVQLRSFGVPYMAPYSPINMRDLRDSMFRVPWDWMFKRPSFFRARDSVRKKGDAEHEQNQK